MAVGIWVGVGTGVAVGACVGVWVGVGVGTGVSVAIGVGVGSGALIVSANRLSLCACADAVEAPKSTEVSKGSQSSP